MMSAGRKTVYQFLGLPNCKQREILIALELGIEAASMGDYPAAFHRIREQNKVARLQELVESAVSNQTT